MKKISAMLLAVCMLFGVSACGKTDTIQADTADLQTRTGYIVIAEDGLHFDAVEVVTKDDTEKIKELRLEEILPEWFCNRQSGATGRSIYICR